MNDYQLLSHSQSVIRTSGLYISISFAALVYSRFHRTDNRSDIRNIGMILMSGLFNVIVYYMFKNLNEEIKEAKKEDSDVERMTDKWEKVIKMTTYMNYGIMMLLFITFINEIRQVELNKMIKL
jgi:Na+/melibiose symporter-like transporter